MPISNVFKYSLIPTITILTTVDVIGRDPERATVTGDSLQLTAENSDHRDREKAAALAIVNILLDETWSSSPASRSEGAEEDFPVPGRQVKMVCWGL